MNSLHSSGPAASPPPRGSCPVAIVTSFARHIGGRVSAPALHRPAMGWLTAGVLAIVLACATVAWLIASLPSGLSAWQEKAVAGIVMSLLVAPILCLIARRTASRLAAVEHDGLATRMGMILSITVDGIIATDAAGRILMFNHAAQQIFGYTEDEVIGRSISELVPQHLAARHDQHVRDFSNGALPARVMSSRGVLVGRRKDETEVPVEISIAKSVTAGELTMIAIVRDVSERRRIEAELRQAKEQAEAASRSKSEFLANISHEIRTPMNAVLGLTELLRVSPLNPEQQKFVETIHNGGETLLSLINDILDFSKIEAGYLRLEKVPFDLRRCVESVVDILAPRAAQKHLVMAHRIDDAVPSTLVGDPTRLQQVLINLLGNAIKFTASGEISLDVRLIGGADDRVTLRVAVRDTGIGISRSAQERLFRPFSQADSTTTRRFGGTGLGLTISRRLVELMGGTIGVESEPNVGSTFFFTASFERVAAPTTDHEPAAPSRDRTPRVSPPDTSADLAARHPLRILLVEDNPVNRVVASSMLTRLGYKATIATDGAEALETGSRADFDVVLMDLQMPVMSGLESARRLRLLDPSRQSRPYIVAMTASVTEEDRQACADVGMDGFLSKPVRLEHLRDILLRASEDRTRRRSEPTSENFSLTCTQP